MCTATWNISEQKLLLAFNRDEQRARPHALPPIITQLNQVKAVYPIDPQGGGSWISVNDAGVIICLLNNYLHAAPKEQKDWTSRGKLITELASLTSHQSINEHINNQGMDQYRAFHLMVLSLDEQTLFTWNGKKLKREKASAYLSSSGFDTHNLLAGRKSQYQMRTITSRTAALDFHTSHQPQKSAYSVCMHRSDAHTTSLSVIEVSEQNISFDYFDGPPCKALRNEPLQSQITLPRKPQPVFV
ncbi:MAG: hypothetical protein ACI9FJ_000947 [Alteromonadaceae bacterium]|jgi:uncharacterized protein with NRDE domain